ncbi:Regulatory protein recX [Desulfamplus magnetovallimortis]|uniref:Regulatory protein RecX n=1 Tax=Desulfamplus magnetovallimortis TaxID=1246637 RepID=A0A1W1H713_9BACT|nr:regulatory protein RecX [Desulfamplus magnetovallimortis]SLM28249.1 Regulatory protein recX [Desulfamplus magnetovallimortis]
MKEIAKAYNICIRLLAPRARSIYEVKEHLRKKQFDETLILDIIEKLEHEKLLNDREFAAMFVEQRERFNPKSKFALSYELKKKGIDECLIEECLMEIDEFASAWNAISSRVPLWQGYEDDKFKKKVMNYLKNRGFGYEVSISTLEKALESRNRMEL